MSTVIENSPKTQKRVTPHAIRYFATLIALDSRPINREYIEEQLLAAADATEKEYGASGFSYEK